VSDDIEPIKLPDEGYIYVDTPEGLLEVVEALRGCTVVGIDTESDSFFSYKERCCLVQVTGNGTVDYIIDPLRLDDLSPLGPMCADPNVVKIFHGADYDVVSMKRDFGVEFVNIFDTMIAAQATGHERFGLNDLVQRYFGEKLDKKWQRHDWSSRPLQAQHLDYARKDSHFLPELRRTLLEQAGEVGRLEMLEEEFELLQHREWTGRPFSADDCMKVKGARGLDDLGRKILRAVYTVREGKAEAKNRPPFKVWGNDVLITVSKDAPTDIDALKKSLGPNHHVVRRYAEEIVAAVLRGIDDETAPPAPPKSRGPRNPHLPPLSREDEALVLKLKNWRNRTSKEAELGPGMIVNNSIISQVAAVKPTTVSDLEAIKDMRRWQRVEFGETLVELVQAWLTSQPEPSDDPPPKRKRRRRRRKRKAPVEGAGESPAEGGTEAAAEGGGESPAQTDSTPDAPAE
jgi:ribonuclease D